ncbi:MAG: hypothetical protein JNM43_16880 [Planctomycetaceae bacterium]|nr:hypothetical protein [Planctomycetaceae bacterium]
MSGRFALPTVIALCVLATPVLWVIGYSLLYSTGAIGLFSDGWTMKHWQAAFRSGTALKCLGYSGIISAVVTLLSVTVATTFVVIAPEMRHSKRLTALLCFPLATPAIVMAFLTYQVLNPGGLMARLLFKVGFINSTAEFPVLVNDSWAVGIIVASFFSQCPSLILYFLKTWSVARIDRYCQLAVGLGASARQARFKVAVPMLLQRGKPLFLLGFLWTMGSYEIPLLLGVQFPMMSSVLIQKRSGQFNLLERPEAFVHATIYFAVVSLCLAVFLSRRHRRA